MTVSSEVQIRYPADLLIRLTNDKDTRATSIVTAKLDAAIADVVNAFYDKGLILDAASPESRYISAACKGTIYYLLEYKGIFDTAFERAREQWEYALMQLVYATSRDRIAPSINTQLQTSAEVPAGVDTRYHSFDRHYMRGIMPARPKTGLGWDEELY